MGRLLDRVNPPPPAPHRRGAEYRVGKIHEAAASDLPDGIASVAASDQGPPFTAGRLGTGPNTVGGR